MSPQSEIPDDKEYTVAIPPQFMKKKNDKQDQARQSGSDAAKRRLEMLRKKKPEGK